MAPEGGRRGRADGDIVIRPAVTGDARRMYDIDQLCFEPDIAYPVDFIYYHLLVLRDPAFCAWAGDTMVGFVLTSLEKRRTGCIVTIDILEPHRRRGLGARLIGLAEQALAERGARNIVLQTPVENVSAIAFYEKLGYVRGRLLKDYYGRNKDAWHYHKVPKK